MKELATALAKAQGKIKAAIKDAQNPAFKQAGKVTKYADLSAVWDACRDALSSNGISVVQIPGFDKDDMWLETMLLHSSGESISGRYPLRPQQNTPQGYGSAMTYARRYSLAAMVGVVADADDDGNEASGKRNYDSQDDEPEPKPKAKPAPTADAKLEAAKKFTDKAIEDISHLMTEAEIDGWHATNAKMSAALKAGYPDLYAYVDGAMKAQRGVVANG